MIIFIIHFSSRLHKRQKKANRDSLLQGVDIGEQVQQAEEPLQQPKQLPSAPVEHGHIAMFFDEPHNREGEVKLRK